MKNVPVVIMCGGQGTRLREETEFKPKPMVNVGGSPMLVHIMRWYAKFGYNKFMLALGYKQEMIKEYFLHYQELNNDLFVSINKKAIITQGIALTSNQEDDWGIFMCNTGENTLKGGRLKRMQKYLGLASPFLLTYGDSIGDVDIDKLLEFHRAHGKIATVTGISNPLRFGELTRDGSLVTSYVEKPHHRDRLINAGFYVFNHQVFDYLTEDENCDLEPIVLKELAEKGQLHVYEHQGQWNCMDTAKDLGEISKIYESGNCAWRIK